MSASRPDLKPVLRGLPCTLAALGVAASLLVALSCGPTSQQRYEQRLARTGTPALHAVQSDRLREIMGRLTYSLTLDPPDRMTEPQRQARQVAEVARAMAANVRNIPDAVKDAGISDKDREVFLKLADKLGTEAQAVSDAADHQDYEATKQAIERMQTTCNACHSLFKG
jgi:hypothetical protein